MKKLNLLLSVTILLVSFKCFAQAPIVSTFSPTSGAIGSSVTITGTGFNTTANQNIVFFGATQATVTAASATTLTVTVPTSATYQYISVTNLAVNLTGYSSNPFIVTLAGNIAFANKTDFTAGTGTASVIIGDIDGDGKPDLVTTNYDDNTVSVLRNTSTSGTASFAAKVDFATGTNPQSVSIGDIDGDGKPDLAVANYSSASVSVFRNTSTSGAISFAANVDFTTGSGPGSVSIGDIDGDGKPDLATANYNDNTVSVLRNTSTSGTVSFAAKIDFITGTNPNSVCIGDIDGDGRPDLATPNGGSDSVSVFLNISTSGTVDFAAKLDFTTGSGPFSIGIGDIDGDGKPDLATANLGNNTASVLRNTSTSGTISFEANIDFTTSDLPVSISIGDIDGDGKPDLAVANYISNNISVIRNTSTSGSIGFAPNIEFTTGTNPQSVSIGDIDGDDRPDLAVANYTSNTVSVIRQIIPPVTVPVIVSAFSPASGAIGSSVTISGSGFNTTANQNIVFFGATQATVTAASATSLTVTVPTGATYQNISVTNLAYNLTGYSSKPFIVTLAGNIAFAPKADFTTGAHPESVSIGDIDGDGKSDLAVANYNSNTVSVLRNTSISGMVSFAFKVDFPTGPGPTSVSIGDIDGDGKPDLVTANNATSAVSVLRNTSISGTISFATKVDFTTGSSPYSVSIGDIDGDGKPDLAVANYTSNTVSVLRNTSTFGVVSFAGKWDFPTGISPRSVSIGDIDGDGKPDLAVANNNSNSTVSVLPNTSTSGTINFGTKVDFPTGFGPYSVSIGDIDGDGKTDLAVANFDSNTASIIRNTSTSGTISFATKVDFTTGSGPFFVSIGDIDGDGKPDLAVANGISASASVFRNTSTSGTVSFAAKVDFTTGSAPESVSIGDIDGDGKPDLATANWGDFTVSVIRQEELPQGSLTANGPFCGTGAGKLTFTATAGTSPFTVVYNDGVANRTATNVTSGTPFNTFTTPVTTTTTYTLVSVSYPNNAIRTSGFTVGSATITVNPLPTVTLGSFSAVCANSPAFALTGGLPAGGTYSGTGVSGGNFNPATTGAGTFTITYSYTDGNTCTKTASANLTVPTIDNSVTVSGTSISANSSTGTYQWIDCTNGNSNISGATSKSFTPTVSGDYAVIVSKNGCSDTSVCNTIAAVTGITNLAHASGLSIFPNPNNGDFMISLDKEETFSLVNNLGQTIQTVELNQSNNNSANVSGVEPGFYFLVSKSNALLNYKVVVGR